MRNTESPQIVIGAHYDTRMFADQDPEPAQNTNYVPGANDGASGVAVLLGLVCSLPEDMALVWLVFFDTEDNGDFPGGDWILGSREFVKRNLIQPRAAIVVDMIGDSDLNIYKEHNSNPDLTDSIWTTAKELGFEGKFITEYEHSMLDDHTPFMEAFQPLILLILIILTGIPSRINLIKSLQKVYKRWERHCAYGCCNKIGNPDKIML